MSDLRNLIARMDQIDSGSLPKRKKVIKEDATAASKSMGGDIISGIKSAGPIVSKVGGKALPALGAAMSADSAHDRYKQGDYTGSAIDAVAAGASLYPPAWPVALGASGVNMLRDKAKEVGGYSNLANMIGQSMEDYYGKSPAYMVPEGVETLDEAGFVKWLEENGLHNLDEGLADLVKAGASKVGPAIKSGFNKLKNLVTPAEKEIADISATKPTDISGITSEVPNTMRVGTPEVPPVAPPVEKPAVFRDRNNPKFDPELSKTDVQSTVGKTDAQRRQDLKDVEARMDALPKPKINAKDYEAQLAKQKELQQQLKDPRPAVWKDPKNPNAPASKNPPPADVAPPQPLNGKSFKDASAEVNARAEPPKINRDELGRELDDLGRPTRTLGGDPINYGPAPAPSTASTSTSTTVANTDKPTQLNPFRGPAPEPSVYGPGGIKNFRRDAPVQPDPSKFSGEESAAYKLAKDKYDQQVNPPGKIATGLAAAGTAAALYGPDIAREYPNLTTTVVGKDPFNLMKNQPPAGDKEQPKESLQNKLFKEFKTFVEKR
jgi:hypothetical protein